MEKISKNQLKYYSSLLNKKNRKLEGKFIAEGRKLFSEAINSFCKCETVFVTEKYLNNNEEFQKIIIQKKLTVLVVNENDMKKLTDTVTPQGVAGVFYSKKEVVVNQNTHTVVALENISDPGNLGTIIRNCDWFGIRKILLSANCAELFNPKTLRASMGSVFHLNITTPADFYSELTNLRNNGFKIINSDLNGENLFQFKMPEKVVVIFSNEADGPTEQISKLADVNISIPKFGDAESLNVASSSAIILSRLISVQQASARK